MIYGRIFDSIFQDPYLLKNSYNNIIKEKFKDTFSEGVVLKKLPPDHEALAKKIADYSSLFVSAWEGLLEDFESGVVYPNNEAELRNFLVAKCVELMSQKKFDLPYQIRIEDAKIYGEERADLTLGKLEEMNTRCVTVEIKYFPKPNEIISDFEKLQKYISKDKLVRAYFVALADISLRGKIIPETLGITKNQIKWYQIKAPHSERTKVALLIEMY